MSSVNLVLSGGGVRGVAHLGAIKAALEYKIRVNAISGVSSGAIAGAFFAKGMLPDEMVEITIENSNFNLRRFNLGFYSKKNLEKVLAKYFACDSFDTLKIPLHIA